MPDTLMRRLIEMLNAFVKELRNKSDAELAEMVQEDTMVRHHVQAEIDRRERIAHHASLGSKI